MSVKFLNYAIAGLILWMGVVLIYWSSWEGKTIWDAYSNFDYFLQSEIKMLYEGVPRLWQFLLALLPVICQAHVSLTVNLPSMLSSPSFASESREGRPT